ncbi:MAG: glycosyltransferase family 39 protein [Clostridia bacterium]|nr:glycosyltransferase family 39 protein [Clostridia bacterium]
MKKKLLTLLWALLLSAFLTVSAENLIKNPEFNEDLSGSISSWQADAWDKNASVFGMEEKDGCSCLFIDSGLSNDARWIQTVKVEPDTAYEFTASVWAEECSYSANARGANISFFNTGAYSESVYDTQGSWQTVTLYGKTAKDQTEVVVALRIGGFSGDGVGRAWFKDVSLSKAEDTGAAKVYDLSTYAPYVASFPDEDWDDEDWDGEDSEFASDTGRALPERQPFKLFIMALACLFLFVQGYLFVKWHGHKAKNPIEQNTRGLYVRAVVLESAALVLVLGAAFAIRLYYAYAVRGYKNDIDCFLYWGNHFREQGFRFYADDGFHDYPPFYMMLLGGVDALRYLFGVEYNSPDHVFLIKLIPILCDSLSARFIYSITRRKLGAPWAVLLCAFIALNPAYIFDSAAWGQVDSLLALLLIVSVYFGMKGRWDLSLPVYALAILTKPQALMFGPIGLLCVVADCLQSRKGLLRALMGLRAAVLVLFFVSFPFAYFEARYNGETNTAFYTFKWLYTKLTGTAMSYKYMTINACNVYVLQGKNWASMEGNGADRFRFFAWFMFAAAYVYSAYVLIGSKMRRVRKTGGKPAKRVLRPVRNNLALAGTVLISILYTFAPMMHERYLFPALLLSLLAYYQFRDRRLIWYFLIVTFTQFLNIALVLEWGEYEAMGQLQGSEQSYNNLVAALNIAATLLISWTAFDLTCGRRIRAFKAESAGGKIKRPLEIGLVLGVTVLYSFAAFLNLGEADSPVSFYQTRQKNEQIVFDLGQVRTYRLTYFGGISSNYFNVSLSNDGENWTREFAAEYGEGDMYKWIWFTPKNYVNGSFSDAFGGASAAQGEDPASFTFRTSEDAYPLQTSRYVRFTVADESYVSKVATQKMIFCEVAFLDENGKPLPVSSVSGSLEGADYAALIDEQDKVAAYPSYYNGMYFDEIYHARTAYELLNGYESSHILEWSHPHLGKLIIAVGIKLFGMTPFGWRFSGTLFGALMLPLMYLLVKALTGKKKWAFTAMLLLSLDSMHFTQTRIATVDTYAVFFIMLMYLFMILFFKRDLVQGSLLKALIPLGLSGISMGLSWASKWTGIYASAGLAVLFFVKVGMSIREYRRLKWQNVESDLPVFWSRLFVLLDFCLVMFVCVPALIYYYSYYWHFAESGGLSIERVWALQEQMYSYHSNITDTHYFKSPWYEWPLIVWPMWYFSSDTAFTGQGVVSSISLMGNPAVWWTGIFAMVVCAGLFAMQKKKDMRLLILLVGFASQYLPWVLVPRSTYIYHYFTSVPFIILATVLALDYLSQRHRKGAMITAAVIVGLALVLFIAFYPLESGYSCSYSYAMKLRWFDWYNFALQI